MTNATLSGHVFSDLNGNGTQDGGEASLSGLTVTITTSAGGTVTTTTDASGNYSATVPGGSTIASVAGPAGATLSTANNPQTVSVPAGATGSATPVGFQPAPPTSTPTPTPDSTPAQTSGGGSGGGGAPRSRSSSSPVTQTANTGEGGGGGGGIGATTASLSSAPASATSSPVPPSTPPNTPDPAPTLGTPQLNLSVIPSGPLIVGQEAALLLTISNTGSADAIGPLTMTDSPPPGFQFGFATDDSGCTTDGQTVTCTSAGPLPAGGSMTLRLPVMVSSEAIDGSVNVATVSSQSLDLAGVTAQSVDTLIAAAPAIDSVPASAAGREPPATGGSGEASTRLVYVVQDGDTLPGIATTVYGDPDRAADLYARNQDLIDGHGLATGVELIVP